MYLYFWVKIKKYIISYYSYVNKILQVANLKVKIQMTERKSKESREIDKKIKKEELNFFRRTNQQLKSQIEAIMTTNK